LSKNQIPDYLDLAAGFYDINNYAKVGILSAYLKLGGICDISDI
jgi:hypothetical protein